jgi:hypothetical protein
MLAQCAGLLVYRRGRWLWRTPGAGCHGRVRRQLPQVTALGDTTGGGSGSVDDAAPGRFERASTVVIGIPTVDLRHYDGLPWEWVLEAARAFIQAPPFTRPFVATSSAIGP